MALTRKFIDWNLAPLPAAVEFLASKFSDSGSLNLSNCIAVLPNRRACRQLLIQLSKFASTRELSLQIPKIVTVGQLPELLYSARRPFASELTQKLAWVSALKSLRRSGSDFFSPPSDENELPAWLDLANLFYQTHEDVASEGFLFQDVLYSAQKIPGFGETQRWKYFARVQEKYFSILDSQGICDIQRERIAAVEKGNCSTTRKIFLIGTVDLNRGIVHMLEQVSDSVTSLVFAPEELAERFDHFGRLIPNHWENARTNVRDEQIEVVEGPEDQAALMVKLLSEQASQFSKDEISIGVGDQRIVRQLENELSKFDVSLSWSW